MVSCHAAPRPVPGACSEAERFGLKVVGTAVVLPCSPKLPAEQRSAGLRRLPTPAAISCTESEAAAAMAGV